MNKENVKNGLKNLVICAVWLKVETIRLSFMKSRDIIWRFEAAPSFVWKDGGREVIHEITYTTI